MAHQPSISRHGAGLAVQPELAGLPQELIASGPDGIHKVLQRLKAHNSMGTSLIPPLRRVSWVGQTRVGIADAASAAAWLDSEPLTSSTVTALDCSYPLGSVRFPENCVCKRFPVPSAKQDKHGLVTQLPALLASAAEAWSEGRRLILCDSSGMGVRREPAAASDC